jgi:MFS family permease
VAQYRWRSVILLEGANGASGVANAIVMIVIPWLVLERTGSAAYAGLVVAAASLPGIVVAPLVGFAIDRFGRRIVSILSDILSALSVAAFPLVALVQDLSLPWILALAVLGATFDPAGSTARKSLLPDVATASGFPLDRLNGIHEGVFGVGWAIGPALGAVLIGVVGPVQAFWVPFGLFVVAIMAIVALRVGDAGQEARRAAGGEHLGAWQGLVLGAKVLWHDRALRAITVALMVLAAVYLPTESVVLPAYFQGRGEPTSLGILVSVMSVGTIVGAFGYGWLARRFTRYQLTRTVLIGTAIAIVPLALLPPLPVMIAAGFLLGLAWGPFSPLMNTLVQRRVPADVQGRVYGVQTSLFYAAPPVAFLLTGWSVETFGVQATYLALALVLVATSIGVLFVRSIRDIDN